MESFLSDPVVALQLTLSLRIIVAAILGGCIGIERSLAGKHAGMRTYGLVAMGSALFVCVGELMPLLGISSSLDPSRIAAAIVMGIGFIGSGVALARGNDGRVGEITTATGIWIAAAIGVACGFGLYILAFAASIVTIFVFVLLMRFERTIERRFAERGADAFE